MFNGLLFVRIWTRLDTTFHRKSLTNIFHQRFSPFINHSAQDHRGWTLPPVNPHTPIDYPRTCVL